MTKTSVSLNDLSYNLAIPTVIIPRETHSLRLVDLITLKPPYKPLLHQ